MMDRLRWFFQGQTCALRQSIFRLALCAIVASAGGMLLVWLATATLIQAQTVTTVVDPVTGDDIINDTERMNLRFIYITGHTTGIAGLTIDILIIGEGSAVLGSAVSGATGDWSVALPTHLFFDHNTVYTITVRVSGSGIDPVLISHTIRTDYTAPAAARWAAPESLTVGEAIEPISPSRTSDTDIAGYSAANLPPGLQINPASGVIHGTPTASAPSTRTGAVILDRAGNTRTVLVIFPAVPHQEPVDRLVLYVAPVTGDDIINITEARGNFIIAGDTGTGSGVAVTVYIGVIGLNPVVLSATSDAAGRWSIIVRPGNVAGSRLGGFVLLVTASKDGVNIPGTVDRAVNADLTPPTAARWAAPESLTVGKAVDPISPSRTSDTDIAGYSAANLPPGLQVNPASGVIHGTPTAPGPARTATVVIADNGGNITPAFIAFPAPSCVVSGALQGAVNAQLGRAEDTAVTTADMAGLTSLSARNQGIADLSCLELAANLTFLDLWGNKLSADDIPRVAGLTNLTWLNLGAQYRSSDRGQVPSLTSTIDLYALTNLTYLQLSSNRLTSLNVSTLTQLEKLSMSFNRLGGSGSLQGLNNLSRLRRLGLYNNGMRCFSGAGLSSLERLYLTRNELGYGRAFDGCGRLDFTPMSSLVYVELGDQGGYFTIANDVTCPRPVTVYFDPAYHQHHPDNGYTKCSEAVSGQNQEGGPPKDESEGSETPPARPTGIVTTTTHDRVILNWADPGDDTVISFTIMRRERDGSPEFEGLITTGSADTTYTDTTVDAGTAYVY